MQLHKEFTFNDAAQIVDYIAALGFSHLYCSPIMKARPGSTHGYDVVDHNEINPEIGTEAELAALVGRLHARGMGMLVDIVPNHVGIGPDNWRWQDVLEWGERSPYGGMFDINWHAGLRHEGKVVLPVLGDQFGRVLASGACKLSFDGENGRFGVVVYGETLFPVSPFDYPALLQAAIERSDGVERDRLSGVQEQFKALFKLKDESQQLRAAAQAAKQALADLAKGPELAQAIERGVAAYGGQEGDLGSWRALGALLDQQNYRLAFWRVASDEVNYRRFFDINELGGVRVELLDVFEETHRKTFRLLEDGLIDGLRIDHIDGLFDPKEYTQRLQARGGTLERPVYVLVEKILAHYEDLRDDWPVAGTTGYDTINQLTALFNDPAGERALTTFYKRFSGRRESFDEVLYQSKLLILRVNLASEVGVLATEMHRVSSAHWSSRDFTFNGLKSALEEVIASFPVYRTYVDRDGSTDADRRYIDWAIGVCKKRTTQADTSIFDFLHGVLTGDLAGDADYKRPDIMFLAMRFQQLSGPAMAKGLEDTSFYRYFRQLCLNEVGGDPRRFFVTPQGFHRTNETRLAKHPLDMLAGSTHDTKRGEDARARLVCLSGVADDWRRRVAQWERYNRRIKTDVAGTPAPDRNDEYYFYQSLLGCWPIELLADDAAGLSALADRLTAAMIKAVREGKEKTSWSNPAEDYERALTQFVQRALDPNRSKLFLGDFCSFVTRVSRLAGLTSAAQTLLRFCMPGIPDVYRGSELWDFSLVDPDNRRPVDYAAYRERLEQVEALAEPSIEHARALADGWRDGLTKLAIIQRSLVLRREQPALFASGGYSALTAAGTHADRIIAFARSTEKARLIVIVPRHVPALVAADSDRLDWQDTSVMLPSGRYVDCFTGGIWVGGETLPLGDVLAHFPVGLLLDRGD